MNIVTLFLKQAAQHPRRIALIDAHASVDYAELLERSEALAARLSAGGLRPGHAVLPILSVGIALYVTLLAALRLGATVVFPESAAGLRGARAAARSAAIHTLVGDRRRHILRLLLPELRGVTQVLPPAATRARAAPAVVDLDAEAPALMTFTSGSTGRPKCVVRSHGFLLAQHEQISAVLRPRAEQTALLSLPMFVLCNLAHGTTSVIADCDWSNPGASDAWPLLRQICRHRVARLVLPPALCERIAATGVQLPQLEEIFTGGGPVFPGLLRRLAQVAPNAAITTVYGGSEAEPIAHVAAQDLSPEDFAQMHAGGGLLAGAPVAGIDLRIEDDEIWVSGAHVIKSYRNPADDRDTKRVRDGKIWHRTGDAGRLDARGRLWLLGRHEARSGGLFPFCVEAAARNLPGVRNAALVHVGTTPTLTLECDGRSAPPLAAELTRRWGDRLRVVLVPRIPLDRRHRSKTDYGELRKLLLRRGYS